MDINYLALGLSGKKQIGNEKGKPASDARSADDINLNDGLTKNELERIDADKDGKITEKEFIAAYGGDTEKAKEIYKKTLEWLSSKSKKNNDGTTTTSQKIDGKTIKSKYDKNGKLISYTVSTYDEATGKTTVVSYSVENGKAKKGKTTVRNLDGTTDTTSADGKIKTKKTNGTSLSVDASGRITGVKDSEAKDGVTFTYDKDGKITSAKVKIGNKTFSGSNVKYSKDGKTATIKDKNGKIIAKMHTNKNGETYISEYKDGKKNKIYKIDEKGNLVTSKTYDSNGNIKEYKDIKTGRVRKYERDKNGNLLSSTDYNAEGKKVSSQTYLSKAASEIYGNKKGHLWASRTFYDENGNVKSYQEYSYKPNSDKSEVTVTVNVYSDTSKKTKTSVKKLTQDSYGNTTKKITTDKDGKVTVKEYEYDTKRDRKLSTPNHYKTVTTTSGNKKIVSSYKDGAVSHKEVQTIKDGVASTTKYDYTYYPDSNNQKKTVIKTDSAGNVTRYDYNPDGSYTKTYKDKFGQTIVVHYDKDGKEIDTK